MKLACKSISKINELILQDRLREATEVTRELISIRPELSKLYESKLTEIQRRHRLKRLPENHYLEQKIGKSSTLELKNLVFVTATCSQNEAKRRAIESTWGASLKKLNVHHYYVIGNPELNEPYRLGQVIYVPCRDDYESLLLKLALSFEYIAKNIPTFTHIFKIDDDCFLNLAKLESCIAKIDPSTDYVGGAIQSTEERLNKRWHFGKCSDRRFDQEFPFDYAPNSYAKGGYGYVISRRAIDLMVMEIPRFIQELEQGVYSYEDLRVGQILGSKGISPHPIPDYIVSSTSSGEIKESTIIYDISSTHHFYDYQQELALHSFQTGQKSYFLEQSFVGSADNLDSLGFDNIYLVNLRSAISRRVTSQFQLTREGIRYEIFSAFDGHGFLGKKLFDAIQTTEPGELNCHHEYSDLEKRRGAKFIESPGAVGYIMTYIRLLQDARRRGYNRILILEDDVFLRHGFKAHLARFINAVGCDWKVLQLGASQYGWESIDEKLALTVGHYHPQPIDTCGSFAIAIDLSIADELINELLSFDGPFDHIPLGQIYTRYQNHCHVAYPNLVIPDVTESYIRGPRDQIKHAAKMRWNLANFDFPRTPLKFGLILAQNAELLSPPSQEYGVELFCYRITDDGLRPVHETANISAHPALSSVKNERYYLNEVHALPVDVLYATDRSCHGAEILLESLESCRFGAVDGRSREWLKPLQNRSRNQRKDLAAVIIPTRGRKEELILAIESVISQDWMDKEIIVIDENDAESETKSFVSSHIKQLQCLGVPIRLISHTFSRNAAAARNTGLFATTAEFVSFLDDDDIYLPGRLKKVITTLKSGGADVGGAYCGFLGWNSNSNDLSRYPTESIPKRLLNLEYKTHYICTNTVTYRREALLSVNGFDESFPRHQDLELNIRIFSKWSILACPEPLVRLNPLPPDNSNKLHDTKLFNVKVKFLNKFTQLIRDLNLNLDEIHDSHAKEIINFTTNTDLVQKFALENPCQFSSAYLAKTFALS